MSLARVVILGSLLVCVPATRAVAQSSDASFEIGGQMSVLRLQDVDAVDVGIGLTAAWRTSRWLAIDGALTWYPGGGEFDRLSDQQRVAGLIGMRAGIGYRRHDVFGRGRAGFLHFGEEAPVVCIAIFPPPLSCRLAGGYTAFAADVGGGVSIGLDDAGRTRLRLEASDLLVRFGGESFRNGEVTDGFVSHNLLVAAGIAWRF